MAWIAARPNPRQAARLLGATQAAWESIPSTLPEPMVAHHVAAEQETATALTARELAVAHRAGARMTREEIVALALGESPEPDQAVLTAREREVAQLVAAGLTDREVAAQLVISVRTAETHVRNVLAKLRLRSRTELAASWR